MGWQEVNDEPDKAAVEAGMPGYFTAQTQLSVPISVRVDHQIDKTGRHQTHGGKHHASPARWVTWVVSGDLAVVNTHFVSGAWNNKSKPHKAWRRLRWTEHERELATIVSGLYARHGKVIVVGDFNRRHESKLHPQARWLDNRGIDKIAAIGITAAGEPRRVRTPSDHDARAVTVTL